MARKLLCNVEFQFIVYTFIDFMLWLQIVWITRKLCSVKFQFILTYCCIIWNFWFETKKKKKSNKDVAHLFCSIFSSLNSSKDIAIKKRKKLLLVGYVKLRLKIYCIKVQINAFSNQIFLPNCHLTKNKLFSILTLCDLFV